MADTQVTNMARTIVGLRTEVQGLRTENGYYRTQRDRWKEQAETTERLIMDAVAATPFYELNRDLAHYTHRMLQALDAYWLHYEGYDGFGHPRMDGSEERWWNRYEKYRARVEALVRG